MANKLVASAASLPTAAGNIPGHRLARALTGSGAVAVIGLSQVLAVGALSVTPLGPAVVAWGVVAAFVAATIGGLCAAAISRAPGEVSGPRTSIAVIYAALCAELVTTQGAGGSPAAIIAALSVAVLLMGLMQALAAWLRLGDAVKFLPSPVSAGFVTGIALLIAWSQIGPLLGIPGRWTSYAWPELLLAVRPLSLIVAVATAAVVWTLPLLTKKVQPLLAGLVVGTALHHVLAQFEPQALGATLGTLSFLPMAESNLRATWAFAQLSWLLDTAWTVLPYAAFMALQGVMNAALSSVSIAEVAGVRPNVNRSLLAQGVANMVCGLLGSLPIGTSPSQSVLAARMHGINTLTPAGSAILLLVAIVFFGFVLSYVPIAVLAALLVISAVGLIDRWARALATRVVNGDSDRDILWNLGIVAFVSAAFFIGGVPLALAVGAILAMVLLAVNLSTATTFSSDSGAAFSSSRVWPSEQEKVLHDEREAMQILRPRGGLFFGTADQLSAVLENLPPSTRYCIIDVAQVTTIDATACHMLTSETKSLAKAGIVTVLAGLNPTTEEAKKLAVLGLASPDPRRYWFTDLDHALEWVEYELIKKKRSDVRLGESVTFANTDLTRDFSAAEADELQASATLVEQDAGATLFRTGEAASSLYVVVEGLVEIRVPDEGERSGRRLAAVGPGAVFGEVAMLTDGKRSADAVCVSASSMYSLDWKAIELLERTNAELHRKLMHNVARHLAVRLLGATEIVRGRR